MTNHHQKLYAPKDFSSDDAFLRGVSIRARHKDEIALLEKGIEAKIREKLTSPELVSAVSSGTGTMESKLAEAADVITEEIRNWSSLTVDARAFTGDEAASRTYPIAVFASLGAFTDEVYFSIQNYVRPYTYGHTWR